MPRPKGSKNGEKSQFCMKGHDILKTGRYKWGMCIQCQKERYTPVLVDKRIKQFCPKGHDKDIVGRDAKDICKKCRKIKYKETYRPHPRDNRFCKHGHDTLICGRYKNGRCNRCLIEYAINYCIKNSKKIKKRQRKYRQTHKKQRNKYFRIKRKMSVSFKLGQYLRSRIRSILKRNKKQGSAVKDLGCTLGFLKDYIAAKFYAGMTWSNWGTVWDLDHIKALRKFDLSNRTQFLKAVNYKNLQPLTLPEHEKKTAKENREWWKKHKKFKVFGVTKI